MSHLAMDRMKRLKTRLSASNIIHDSPSMLLKKETRSSFITVKDPMYNALPGEKIGSFLAIIYLVDELSRQRAFFHWLFFVNLEVLFININIKDRGRATVRLKARLCFLLQLLPTQESGRKRTQYLVLGHLCFCGYFYSSANWKSPAR